MPLDPERLVQTIEEASPTWLRRAKEETDLNCAAGRFASKKTIWSDIKPIFVSHQRRKCAYCERQLGSSGIEWDVEHFRPKKKVAAWSSPSAPDIPTGGADPGGYFPLAFDPRNYLVACKPCNSVHKGNLFPVASRRRVQATDVDEARAEEAFLLNPLDPLEQPPEELIGFRGVSPRLVGASTAERLRAQFTIELVGLDRPDLDLERAEKVMHMWNTLRLAERGEPDAPRALAAMTGAGSPHANCARCFEELFESNRPAADRIGDLATEFVSQHSQ